MFPFEKLAKLIAWLRGTGAAPSRNALIHMVTDLINWFGDTMFPEKPTTAALPAWLTGPLAQEVLMFLFSLVKRFVLPGMASVTAEGDVAMADKLELFAASLPK